MPYTIYDNNDGILLTISDGQVDNYSTSLDLVGKNLNNYGEYVNNNFVKLLTNFSSENIPRNPKEGQLWYDEISKKIKVFNGIDFVSAYGTHVAGTQPISTSTGDFWYDTINSQLKIWNGSNFKTIAPSVSGIYGKFGIDLPASTIYTDNTNVPKNVSVVYSYGSSVGFISTTSFFMNTSSSMIYLGSNTATEVISGLTIFEDLEVKGDVYIQGNILTPVVNLSVNYDITPFGDPEDLLGTTSSRLISVNNANNVIRFDLKKVFPVETISSLTQVAYALNSEVRVLCNYNTTTSVRRFILQELIPGSPNWEPYDLYYNSWTETYTNIVL